MDRKYCDMDVQVVWGVENTLGYGKVQHGRYDGCALQQDGYAMLMLYGGNWVRIASVTPEAPASAKTSTPITGKAKADIDSAYQVAGANRATRHAPKLQTTDSAYHEHNLGRLQAKTVEVLNL